jgi:hypothetical protein
MAASSPENPVPMITVSKCRGCLGFPAYAETSVDADRSAASCLDAHMFREMKAPVAAQLCGLRFESRRCELWRTTLRAVFFSTAALIDSASYE